MTASTWLRCVGLCCFAVVLGALVPGWSQETKGKRYALLVGVTECDSKNFSTLNYTANDAEETAKVLKKAGFASVRVLTNSRDGKDSPTAENVRAALKELLAKKTKHDTVLVGLAGHGMQLEVTDKDGKDPKSYSYFCPRDASLLDVSHSTGRSDHLILLDDLFDLLGKCDAGHRLALIDACRNDGKAKATKRARLDVNKVTIPDGVGVLFSCSRGQFAFETEKIKHGVFFHHVIEGLKGAAADKEGVVSWDGLSAYVKRQVPRYVKDNFDGGAKQIPASVGNLEGESILVLPGKEKVVETKDDFGNSVGMKFVRVKAGTFLMGSPKDEKEREAFDKGSEEQHEVEITKDYFLGVTEVTQKQYRTVMGYHPSSFSKDGKEADTGKYSDVAKPAGKKDKVEGKDTDDFPVDNVSWEDAHEFLKKLNKLAAEKNYKVTYRLPTEAEWEYACRGGHLIKGLKDKAQLPFHFKTPSASLGAAQANFDWIYPYGDGKRGDPLNRTNTVGKNGEANALGLFDMHGNVYEWCSDWYGGKYYATSPRKDPTGPDNGSDRALRGGGWTGGSRYCRAAARSSSSPSFRSGSLGFRVAAVPHE
jgi:formylglycine-generating enzyme required for sulfatase activity